MSEPKPLPRNRLKTRSGCIRCKQRRIKCDETHPSCNQCTRRADECPGYKRPLKWSSKYEVGGECRTITRPQGPDRTACKRITNALGTMPPPATISPLESTTFDGLLASNAGDMYTNSAQDFPGLGQTVVAINNSGSETRSSHLIGSGGDLLNIHIPELQHPASMTGSPSLEPPMPLYLEEEEDTGIFRHYFIRVCRINSCFDSHMNFLRIEVGNMMASCPLIYHCVLSMSAAHLATQKPSMITAALNHRAKATSCLKSEVMRIDEGRQLNSRALGHNPAEALLGSILLGMTDGWHNPSFLGTTHLHGARALFSKWMATESDPAASPSAVCSARTREFMIGTMSYWEAMASFFMNQSLDAISYLDVFCDQGASYTFHPNPWTGICTPLFIYLAKAGTLARQRSLIRQISMVTTSTNIQKQLASDLLQCARQTEVSLLQYGYPTTDRIGDTGDPLTPVSHLLKLAQIYRLAGLLEIYQNFPELLDLPESEGGTSFAQLTPTNKILHIAIAILTIIAATPRSSGVNCLLTIPLIIAGSALQPARKLSSGCQQGTRWTTLSAEILSIPSQDGVHIYWRDFVRERLQALRSYVGVATISRAIDIIEKVWNRADIETAASYGNTGCPLVAELIHWTDVMIEEKLETILG
ncbi:fungal-specific transcription factor domain-containing protein [Aspergillus granulosus]|uniref:Fungal-specific transcription factor domain-containing protein n=1 Tax=Aspergillus granulosus TaxID=176169 RepID=A0ABR4GS61_9EURO